MPRKGRFSALLHDVWAEDITVGDPRKKKIEMARGSLECYWAPQPVHAIYVSLQALGPLVERVENGDMIELGRRQDLAADAWTKLFSTGKQVSSHVCFELFFLNGCSILSYSEHRATCMHEGRRARGKKRERERAQEIQREREQGDTYKRTHKFTQMLIHGWMVDQMITGLC